MEFMTGYYRQKEDSTALLLQQYVCRGVPVCFGCICGGVSPEAGIAGGMFTGMLLEKFRSVSLLRAVGKQSWFLKKIEGQLYRCRENCTVPADFWIAGILCIGENFLIFSEGEVRITLCNIGFGRSELHVIGGESRGKRLKMWTRKGIMEKGIGIFLAPESLYRNISREDMKNCLAVRDIRDSGQTRKRVRELGGMAERKGGRGMGALLLEVR